MTPISDAGVPPGADPVLGTTLYATADRVTPLEDCWEFAELAPGAEFDAADPPAGAWRAAIVPGTVAGALRSLGDLDEAQPSRLDERAFLFRKRFRHDVSTGDATLVLEGLATLADVWLNGNCVLKARNMFRCHAVDVGKLLRPDNELVLHFPALVAELAQRRPRGRWTTRLVNHRNLRYVRTTLLGRMPGWAPPHAPVGPWRGVRLVENRRVHVERLSVKPELNGADGVVSVALAGRTVARDAPAALEIRVGDAFVSAPITSADAGGFRVAAEVRVPDATPWWPHDLGAPHRYPVTLGLRFGDETVEVGAFRIGFRRIEAQGGTDAVFALRINGREVFCRGACWTPSDAITLADDAAAVRRVIGLVRDAGMNMLRLSGTMVYESNAFYEACDEFGILVWQDFMFASMDYPEDDSTFAGEVAIETEQVLARLHHHPCLAVLCGNSEVEQQAAMKGLPPDSGKTALFSRTLRDAGARWCPGLPYVSSSPTGGAMPFHVDTGVAHYFGVGAYLRPLSDARESRVGFASECLAFSNVPEDESLDELFADEPRAVHSPGYKRGVPRDTGAGWDFADVTDHYLEQLFQCDVRTMRYADTERYFALARVVPGELMERTLGLWRAEGSRCRGALVWFLRDLQPGSGWGVLDSAGRPKAPYWFLKRACAMRAIWFTDEGLNGLRAHVRNERPEVFAAQLRVRLLRADGVAIGDATTELRLDAGEGKTLGVDALLGRFADTTHSYRFGPCEHAIAVAELIDSDGAIVATAHHLPTGLRHELREDISLQAVAEPRADGMHDLRITSRRLALFVRISIEGFLPSDNYFHIPPGDSRVVVLRNIGAPGPLRGRVSALNARSHASVEVKDPPA